MKKMPKGKSHYNYRHGHSLRHNRSRTYASWRCMLNRCLRLKDSAYPEYGGRGIKVCNRWNPAKGGSFLNFLIDMGKRPKGKTLDRSNNEKGYFPRNCTWEGSEHQRKNRRKTRAIQNFKTQELIAELYRRGVKS